MLTGAGLVLAACAPDEPGDLAESAGSVDVEAAAPGSEGPNEPEETTAVEEAEAPDGSDESADAGEPREQRRAADLPARLTEVTGWSPPAGSTVTGTCSPRPRCSRREPTGGCQDPISPHPREHLDATAVGEEVYVIAGRAGGFETNRDSVEVLRDGAWVEAPSLQHPRGGIGADTVDGMPCVAGGERPKGTIATVECLAGDAWRTVAELEVARHGRVVAAFDGNLHVVGGGPVPGITVSDVHEVIPITLP